MGENGVDELILSCSGNEVSGHRGAAAEVNPFWGSVYLSVRATDVIDAIDNLIQELVSFRVLVYQAVLPGD